LSVLCVIPVGEVGPKLSEATKPLVPPEPLVRDESLRKTDNVREWDKGKKPVHGNCLLLQLFLSVSDVRLVTSPSSSESITDDSENGLESEIES